MPEGLAWNGMVIVAVALLGYVLLLRVLANLVLPVREELFDLGDEMLQDPKLGEDMKEFVVLALRTALAYRSAMVWAFGALGATAMVVILPLFRRAPAMATPLDRPDLRVKRFVDLYLKSIVAANPVFGALSYALMQVLTVLSALMRPFYRDRARLDIAHYTATHVPA